MPPKISDAKKEDHKNKIRNRKLSQWQEELLSKDLINQDWKVNGKIPQPIRDSVHNYCFICSARKSNNSRGSKRGHKLYDFSKYNFYDIELTEFLTGIGFENEQLSPQRDEDLSELNSSFGNSRNKWGHFLESLTNRKNSMQHQLKVCAMCRATFNLHSRNDNREGLLPRGSIRNRSSKTGSTKKEYIEQREVNSSFQILRNGQPLQNQSELSDTGPLLSDNDQENKGHEVNSEDVQRDDIEHDDANVDTVEHDQVKNDELNHDDVNIESNSPSENVSNNISTSSDSNMNLLNEQSQSLNVLYTLPVIDADEDTCCLCLGHTDIMSGCLMNHHMISILGKNAIRDRIGDGISITFDTSNDKDFMSQVICDSCCIFDDEKVKFEPQSVDLRPKVFTREFLKPRNIEPKPIFDKDLIKSGVMASFIDEVNEKYMTARIKMDNMTKLALKSEAEIDRLTKQLKQASLFVYDELTLRKLCGVSYRDVNEIKRYLAPFAGTFSIFKGGETVRKLNLDELITAFFFLFETANRYVSPRVIDQP